MLSKLVRRFAEVGATPIGIAGALGVASGLTVAAVTRARAVPTARRDALTAYLREHLSGADAAIQVVERLGRTQSDGDYRRVFASLAKQFSSERDVLQALLARLGAASRSPKRALARALSVLLKPTAGGAKGEMSLFRTLEALAIGVQGKRCLWRALQSLSPRLSVPGSRSLSELEGMAVDQWETIERCRRALVQDTFATGRSVTTGA